MTVASLLAPDELPSGWDTLCGSFDTTRTLLGCAAEVTGGEVGAICVRDGDDIVAATRTG